MAKIDENNANGAKPSANYHKKKMKSLTNMEISAICSQLAMMQQAGVTIAEAFLLLSEDAPASEGRDILLNIYDELEKGNSLYESMKAPGVFPRYALEMISVGEQTGNLERVFLSIAEYYERQNAIEEGIRQAVTYPFIMIMMMLCVILVLLIKVMPIFKQVYAELGTEMNGLSALIVNIGTSMGDYTIVFIGILLLIIGVYYYFAKTESGKKVFSAFTVSFPLTRGLQDKLAAGHFSSAMALALTSGYNTEAALPMVRKIITNKFFEAKLAIAEEYIQNGEPFSEAIANSEIFSGSYARMLSIGYKTGQLDNVMRQLAKRYQAETDREISRFVSLLEPALVAVLSIVVGIILLSVMLPLIGIMTSLG